MESLIAVNSCSLVSPHEVLSVLPPKVTFPGLPMKNMVGKHRVIPRPSLSITAYEPENSSKGATEYWGKPTHETELVGKSDLLKSTDHGVAAKTCKLKTIGIFCGSSNQKDFAMYTDVAEELGNELVKRGINLVYGGRDTKVNLMSKVAETVQLAGGHTVVVVPMRKGECDDGKVELVAVDDMTLHKAEMARRADAFISLPGGVGTLEEILELTTWARNKPIGLLNMDGSYDSILSCLDFARLLGSLEQARHECVLPASTVPELLQKLLDYAPCKCKCKCKSILKFNRLHSMRYGSVRN